MIENVINTIFVIVPLGVLGNESVRCNYQLSIELNISLHLKNWREIVRLGAKGRLQTQITAIYFPIQNHPLKNRVFKHL